MTLSVEISAVAGNSESPPAKQAMRSDDTMAPWQAGTLRAYIASHLDSKIRVMDLVRLVQLTPNRFFRLFKKCFGCTPHQYVMRARIVRAQRLLLMSEDTLEKIASECGFGNKSRLANLFRDAMGQPPGQWRRIQATSKRELPAGAILLDGKNFDASPKTLTTRGQCSLNAELH
jgi:transcriptional regulator GlxA family with amidase domain